MADDGSGETHEIWMWPAEEFLKVNEELKSHTDADVVALTQLIQSASKSARQIKLLGILGRAYIHVDARGRKYVIFKGYAGLRPNLAGTRYSAMNPRVSCFVVGTKDIIEDAAKGTKVAIIAFVVIDVIQELQEDHFSLASLGVRIFSDVIQGVAAAAVGAAAGILVTTIGVPTVIAFAVVIGVGFLAGVAFTELDRRFKLTERARAAMMDYERKVGEKIGDAKAAVQQTIQSAGQKVDEVAGFAGAVIDAAGAVVRVWRTLDEFLNSDFSFNFR